MAPLNMVRPISRDLDDLPIRHGVPRLHVDRPILVSRQDGQWLWRCELCPLPLRLVRVATSSWRLAVAEADEHLRTEHRADSAARVQAPAA